MDFLNSSKKWTWPALFILFLTPLTPWIDLSIARFFYANSNDPVEHFISNRVLTFLFEWGPMPANFTAGFAAILLIFSYVFKNLKKWKNPCLVLLLTYALGAGLIINGGFKEYWGRPRPKQIEEFGGHDAFRAYYQPNFFHQKQPSKSFTCGHCAMGFYFFALGLVARRLKRPSLEKGAFIFAFTLGIALSISRMMQGGHFFTDTLFSALIMWYTSLCIDWLVYKGKAFP